MSKYKFPIAEVSENMLISMKGEKSYFFEASGVDLEQLNDLEFKNFYNRLETSLNNLDENDWIKIYRIDRKIYLNTNSENLNLSFDFVKSINPLQKFFGAKDIYSDIGIYDDYFLFNGNYTRLLSVRNFSQNSSNEIPKDCDLCLIFRKRNNSKALNELSRIRISQSVSRVKNNRDFEGEGSYSQAEELISKLVTREESLFDMEMYFLVKERELKELHSSVFNLIEECKVNGIETFIEGHDLKLLKSGLFQIFCELIPGVNPSFKYRSIPNKTGHLKYLIPLDKSSLMDKGISFGDINGDQIFFNPFDSMFKNKNMLVTGSSGGGKSVFVNKLIFDLYPKHPVVILDKGGSFKKLCLYFDGYHLKSGINPMDFKCPQYLREFILSVVDRGMFKKLERGLLLKRIKEYLSNNKDHKFSELISYLESDFKGLSLYFEDLKEFLTEEKSETKNFLYIDIEEFPKSQIAPLIIYILEYFKNIGINEKILVFDECWSFLKDHGEYIDECFRTLRKSGAFPIAISQGLDDFNLLNENLSNSIINNSYFKVFFPQDLINHSEISEFDNLRISNLSFSKGAYSQCYLKTQDEKFKKVLSVLLSPVEYELFHTEAGRSETLFKFYDDHKDYFESNKDVIDAYVRLRHETY